MAPQLARKEDVTRAGQPPPPAARGCAPAAPGPEVSLDPLVFALSRAVDRLGPGLPPGPRPDAAG